MRRKSLFMGIGVALLLVTSVGVALAMLVHHEKAFYCRCAVPPGPVRKQYSDAFWAECQDLISNINGRRNTWYAKFTDAQINSFFEEQFIQSNLYKSFLPDGVSDPRIAIETDKIRLGFRYSTRAWSTVVSIDLRVWLAKQEANVVCLELQGLHAGSVPISSQSLLEHISEACQHKNIEVKWYRHNGNPVARLRFQNDGQRPTVQLSKLELRQGLLVLGGRSVEPNPPSGALASNLMGTEPATE